MLYNPVRLPNQQPDFFVHLSYDYQLIGNLYVPVEELQPDNEFLEDLFTF